jgi:membrane-associated phospholipid phosphatase
LSLLTRFRTSEWILLAYFSYVAVIALWFGLPGITLLRAFFVLTVAFAVFAILTKPELHTLRDWVPLVFLLIGYRQMDWFSTDDKPRVLENLWLGWDHRYLYERGFREWIEVLGPLIPGVLELSYVLVYGIGSFGIAALYIHGKRDRVDRFLTLYLTGTLLSYALFPYFPSDPPRVVFPGADMPNYVTFIRQFNLRLVGDYGIHSSVFPSAHVSSAFAAAWGLLRFLPERAGPGITMLVYGFLVALATIYGRYHYAVDAVAGIAVSWIALALSLRMKRRD